MLQAKVEFDRASLIDSEFGLEPTAPMHGSWTKLKYHVVYILYIHVEGLYPEGRSYTATAESLPTIFKNTNHVGTPRILSPSYGMHRQTRGTLARRPRVFLASLVQVASLLLVVRPGAPSSVLAYAETLVANIAPSP